MNSDVALELLAATARRDSGDGVALLLFGAMAVLLAIGVTVAILRWALRINEMVKYQRSVAENMAALRRHVENHPLKANC